MALSKVRMGWTGTSEKGPIVARQIRLSLVDCKRVPVLRRDGRQSSITALPCGRAHAAYPSRGLHAAADVFTLLLLHSSKGGGFSKACCPCDKGRFGIQEKPEPLCFWVLQTALVLVALENVSGLREAI